MPLEQTSCRFTTQVLEQANLSLHNVDMFFFRSHFGSSLFGSSDFGSRSAVLLTFFESAKPRSFQVLSTE